LPKHRRICKDSQSQIYNYNKIGRSKESYTDKKIHVITANTLLGNPGEMAIKILMQKNTLKPAKTLREEQHKSSFYFDEIHDTIHNFKEEFVFNLWNWKNVLHKNFIISATFMKPQKLS
jgi:hypothetical protein